MPIIPILVGVGVGWVLRVMYTSRDFCCQEKHKDGELNPNGDGSRWSHFYGSWDYQGVKP
jgi:hypothetical protein